MRRQFAAAALEVPEREPTCGCSTPPEKSRPVCIIWWPVSWTAVAVW